MEWKVSREKLPVTEIILDEVQEQDFAQGLVLPDYDPEIFRVISCEAEPSVTGWQLQGNRLTDEVCVELLTVLFECFSLNKNLVFHDLLPPFSFSFCLFVWK